VEVAGELEMHSAPHLRQELLQACEGSEPRVLVDLSGLSFIDSTGIGVLVGALKRARENGGSLVLVCASERIRRVFEITGLLQALPLYASKPEALEALVRASSASTASASTVSASTVSASAQESGASLSNTKVAE